MLTILTYVDWKRERRLSTLLVFVSIIVLMLLGISGVIDAKGGTVEDSLKGIGLFAFVILIGTNLDVYRKNSTRVE